MRVRVRERERGRGRGREGEREREREGGKWVVRKEYSMMQSKRVNHAYFLL